MTCLSDTHAPQQNLQPADGADPSWQRRDLRVPRADASILAVPELQNAVKLAQRNAKLLSGNSPRILNRPLVELRTQAKREIAEAAAAYTSHLLGREVPTPQHDLLFLTGHQPALFHPGVWFKNFALSSLSAQAHATAVNLIVDNDQTSSHGIEVPYPSHDSISSRTVDFDARTAAMPWEERTIRDQAMFDSFAQRVTELLEPMGIHPLLADIWPAAREHSRHSPLLGECLTAARCRLEHRWGLENLELPISRMCELPSFFAFAADLLARLDQFCEIHNRVLDEYRQLYHIRSKTHPVPELEAREGSLEAPFWIWRAGQRRRGHLHLRKAQGRCQLVDETGELFATLPTDFREHPEQLVPLLQELAQQGIRLRTRALTTTLFSRVFLGELFIHGVGGAKYDEMTDRIISQFYGLCPPGYLTLSATLLLPVGDALPVSAVDVERLQKQIRQLWYQPERFVSDDVAPSVQSLLQEKQRLIAERQAARKQTGLTRQQRRARRPQNYARFARLQEITAQLRELTQSHRELLIDELNAVQQQLRDNAVLHNREFSWCLFPEQKIREFFTGVFSDA